MCVCVCVYVCVCICVCVCVCVCVLCVCVCVCACVCVSVCECVCVCACAHIFGLANARLIERVRRPCFTHACPFIRKDKRLLIEDMPVDGDDTGDDDCADLYDTFKSLPFKAKFTRSK